ncbi:hypothetical protein MUO14_04805 [Halobacillus shinanisalinarum]|uniref:Uncharacterized protein n=1 Tax=Halobacillus shinanisalinarum TaxID=2932258 RepID=A0ABY4H1H3_9BACI|nr:hypothetical protein [Halobacillus shinanisalinarum]UOQ94285.1 hypothetical protein MUO14_04805 [Halobacillus shinanisalinarum]
MKQWHKEIDSDSHKKSDLLIAFFILTFVAAVYLDRPILLIPSGLMLTLFIAGKAYDRWSGGSFI